MALDPGKKSTEFWWLKLLSAAALGLSVLAGMGKVPFTPDQVTAYMQGVMATTVDYITAFSPYITALAGYYMWLRSNLKKKNMDSEVELAKIAKESNVST